MDVFLTLYPLLIFLALLVMLAFVLRLNSRLGHGPGGAGALAVERPTPPGLQQTPWELNAISRMISGNPGSQRNDMVITVNTFIDTAGLKNHIRYLPPNASNEAIDTVIAQLERHLELPSQIHSTHNPNMLHPNMGPTS